MTPRTVIIGGSSGMGLGIAKAFSQKGHEVIIASRSAEKLKRAQQELKAPFSTYVLDITQEETLLPFFQKIGPFDHLIITAADFRLGPFLSTPTANAKIFFDNKFWGQYNAAKQGAPFLRPGGSILFFGGILGQKPTLHFAFGCALNAAIEGLTRALALELAPLRVNAIAPGMIDTPAWDSLPEPQKQIRFAAAGQKLPAGRIGKPADIAAAALYLAECGFATGSILYVDGGERLI